MLRKRLLLLVGSCIFASLLSAVGDEWTQFRGFDYNRTAERNVAERWTSSNVGWKTPLPGRGASSPVVFGDRIYLTAYTGYGIDPSAPGNPRDLQRHLFCINSADGKIIWQKSIATTSDENPFNSWGVGRHGFASSTLAIDETGIYAFFGASGVLAFDHQGEETWRTNVGKGTHAFGAGNSPVLHKNLVIINASVESGALIALNKSDGSEVWRQPGMDASWNTPVVYKSLGGDEELAVTIKGKILAFDPATGKPLWNCDGIDDYICPSITVQDGILYAVGGRRSRTIAIRSGGSGDVTESHRLWDIAKGSNVSSPVYHDGYLFWAKEKSGILYCAHAKTGEIAYEERLTPACDLIYASPLLAEGRLYYVTREDGIYVVPAKPEFELLAHTTMSGDDSIFNASPVPLDGGAVLVRSDKFLYRIKPGVQ
jgi:outer membrane protein assembly factor BamB